MPDAGARPFYRGSGFLGQAKGEFMEVELTRAFTLGYRRVNKANVGPDETIVIRLVPSPPPGKVPAGRFARDGRVLGKILAGFVPVGTADRAISELFGTSVAGETEVLDAGFSEARLNGASVEKAVRAALGPSAPEALVKWVSGFARRAERSG